MGSAVERMVPEEMLRRLESMRDHARADAETESQGAALAEDRGDVPGKAQAEDNAAEHTQDAAALEQAIQALTVISYKHFIRLTEKEAWVVTAENYGHYIYPGDNTLFALLATYPDVKHDLSTPAPVTEQEEPHGN